MEMILNLRQLQQIYLEMLEQFHEYCQEQGLTYYMVGGTLLGAVREKGFIPWDDDVDIAMPRPDYLRFIRDYCGPLRLQSPNTTKGYCFPYAKLFHGQRPVVTVHDEGFSVRGDVMVQFDIYPIDGLGNDPQKAQKQVDKVRGYKRLLYLNQSRDRSKNPVKNIALSLVRKLPGKVFAKWVDRKMQRYLLRQSTLVTRWREDGISENIVSKEVFGEPVLLPFENLQLYGPQDPHAYLTVVYGDYSEEEREEDGLRHDVCNSAQSMQLAQSLKKP